MSKEHKLKNKIIALVIFGAILFLPVLLRSDYFTSNMILVALYGILSLGMGILLGQAGLFSLAHPAWFGIGAYVTGILSANNLLPPGFSIIIAALFVGVLSYIIGAPLLRLRGYYLACATFALLLIVQIAAGQLRGLTGGHEGLLGIPALSVGGIKFTTDLHFYYLSWCLCIICFWFCYNMLNSRFGRAIRSAHDSESASMSLGVNIAKFRLQVFVLTAVMASLAGSLFCFYLRFIMPGSFGFALLVQLLMMIVIGGFADIKGPLLGSFVVLWLNEFIQSYLGNVFPIMTSEVNAVFFGVLIIIVLIFMPGGVIGWLEKFFRFGEKSKGENRIE